MIRAPSLLAAAAILTACRQADTPLGPSDAPPVAVNPAVTHFRDRQLFTNDLVVTNPCSGENVLLHLRQQFTIQEVSVEGKFFHGHFTFNDRGTTGEGLTSGAVYRQTGAEQDFLHLKGAVAAARRIEITLNPIGQGKAPNFLGHEIFHLIVSPTGAVKLEFDKIRQVCRG
jgi:hypothetical protein